MHTTIINAKSATGPGALNGWNITCTCGLVLTTSLGKRQAVSDGQRHLDWHDRSGR